MELLREKLLTWDRKHTSPLIEVYQSHAQHPSFIDNILALYSADRKLDHATTWLLKYHVDQGGQLEPGQVESLLQQADQLDYWESQLHVLQLIPNLVLTKKLATSSEPWIRGLLKAEKKFVKAAAYEAYAEVVHHLPELRAAFKAQCEEALTRESASVNVKIKRILNTLAQHTNQG